MSCPRCNAETRYVLNEARTEILGTACTKCDWQQGPGLAVDNTGTSYVPAKPLQFIKTAEEIAAMERKR
jgi:hypothetical protein